jgi:hypothetical protein
MGFSVSRKQRYGGVMRERFFRVTMLVTRRQSIDGETVGSPVVGIYFFSTSCPHPIRYSSCFPETYCSRGFGPSMEVNVRR